MGRKPQWKAQLEEMRDKTFEYAGQVHFFKSFIVDEEDEKVVINTNLNSFNRKFESMPEFLGYWKPAVINGHALPEEESNGQLEKYVSQESALADEMINILKDNIAKVQKDAGYVKQATVINNNVNSIINVVRTKMDFLKQVKRK